MLRMFGVVWGLVLGIGALWFGLVSLLCFLGLAEKLLIGIPINDESWDAIAIIGPSVFLLVCGPLSIWCFRLALRRIRGIQSRSAPISPAHPTRPDDGGNEHASAWPHERGSHRRQLCGEACGLVIGVGGVILATGFVGGVVTLGNALWYGIAAEPREVVMLIALVLVSGPLSAWCLNRTASRIRSHRVARPVRGT